MGQMRGWYKDYEFSRRPMRERWAKDRSDTQLTLAASPWLKPAPPEVGARTFDVTRDLRDANTAVHRAQPDSE